jgi:UDP-GlcNAc:undecaprenyl-phosphate/decaprenyl-phosphate GlcNAc-1-phosphate transferase
MHPSLEYGLVFCIAAAGSLLLTPLARLIAVAWGAVATPRDRDVHAVPTPRLGGLALYAGLLLAIGVAHTLPTLRATFAAGSEITGVLLAGGLLVALGALDDRFELDSLTKLAGQVAAAGVMVIVGGVQLLQVSLPWGSATTISLGPDNGVPLTILLTVLAINAVNFIDGLDGLAAGVTAISALAFFAFSYHLAVVQYYDIAAAPTLLAAALAGTCVGFLPHNFSPARVFMGDSGSMLVGLVLAAVAVTASGRADALAMGGLVSAPVWLALVVPLSVLALPLMDLGLAVIRRIRRGQSPFAPDKEHLHHRLMEIGHSHRRAVLLLYFWSALLAFGGVAASFAEGLWLVMGVVAALVLLGLVISAVPSLRSQHR